MLSATHVNFKLTRKRRGSGDPSGLQNRRESASLALVGSTPTRFRQFLFTDLAEYRFSGGAFQSLRWRTNKIALNGDIASLFGVLCRLYVNLFNGYSGAFA